MVVEDMTGAVTDHGGSIERARNRFPGAPEPWVDLSTGINPHSYPHRGLAATVFSRLPERGDLARLGGVAAAAYAAPGPANVVAAPGTQILLPLVMALVPPGRAAVLSPTYAEHARAATLAGHEVHETGDIADLSGADLAVLVNPNNPDGRVTSRMDLLDLAERLSRKGGLLVVDEAFMDVGPPGESVAADVEALPVVVLRSFGKFFGLAGVRLGFAIASRRIAARLEASLGPWAVSGPAMQLGLKGLADPRWQSAMRERLHRESQRLDDLIRRSGLSVSGGTSLFRLVRDPHAAGIFSALGERGVLLRAFDQMPDALRFGLPGSEDEWTRLEESLRLWSRR